MDNKEKKVILVVGIMEAMLKSYLWRISAFGNKQVFIAKGTL